MRKCMTANEIADGLAQMHIEKDVNGLFNKRIQNMLRQQQAEIEASKALLVEEQDESFDRTASHMAGEYVSYKKELTDEEIMHMAKDYCHYTEYRLAIQFARAILRKAQEK